MATNENSNNPYTYDQYDEIYLRENINKKVDMKQTHVDLKQTHVDMKQTHVDMKQTHVDMKQTIQFICSPHFVSAADSVQNHRKIGTVMRITYTIRSFLSYTSCNKITTVKYEVKKRK